MKKRMKQLLAAMMAVAMVFSLAAVASASTVPGTSDLNTISDTGSTISSQNNTVTSQGGLPADVINIVLPTAPANAFSLLIDAHKLLDDTQWKRYAALDGNDENPAHDSGTLFFKNVTKTAKDKTAKLTADVANTTLKKDDKVVVYAKATVNKMYALRVTEKAYPEGDGMKFSKWVQADGTDVNFTAAPYDLVAQIKDLDPTHGYGLDAIAKINADKFVDLKITADATATAANTNLDASVKGMVEYSFNSYSDSDLRYVGVDKTTPDSPADKVFSALDGTAATETTVAALETAGYVKQQENKGIVSYKNSSSTIQVINKSNRDIGVSMKAELKNIPGGDGSLVGEGASAKQTYVYANSIGTGADAGKFYSDQKDKNGNLTEIKDVPVIYMQLTSNAGDTEVMTYDSASAEGVVSISAAIPGKDTWFEKRFNAQPTATDPSAGTYFYYLDSAKRESDFITPGNGLPSSAMTFQISGTINEETADDSWWDSFPTGSEPTMDVTWSVKSFKTLKTPTVDIPTFNATKWTLTVSENPDAAVVKSVVADGVELDFTDTKDASTGGTKTIVLARVLSAEPTSSLVIKFVDPNDAVRSATFTKTYVAPTPNP